MYIYFKYSFKKILLKEDLKALVISFMSIKNVFSRIMQTNNIKEYYFASTVK